MFLSIVIPVYNAESTIGRCLDSIWRQALPDDDYEVICVDDCSTDESFAKLHEIVRNHHQLRVLRNQENLRAGGARNHGVMEARGEYVVFIDADDVFYENTLAFAFEYLHVNDLDILMLDMSRQKTLDEDSKPTLLFKDSSIMNGISFIETNTCPFGPTKYIFKKELMLDNNIWFEECCCCEDVDWVLGLTIKAERIQYLPKILMIYLINRKSTTANEHKSFRTISDKIAAGIRLMKLKDAAFVPDKIAQYISSVAMLYFNEGIKYMAACRCSVKMKVFAIRELMNFIPPPSLGNNLSLMGMAVKYPVLYSHLTNFSSYMLPYMINIKRIVKGR